MTIAGDIEVLAYDVASLVDRFDVSGGGTRNINGRERAILQQKAVFVTARIDVKADDLTMVVDRDRPGRSGTVRIVDVAIGTVAGSEEPVAYASGVPVFSDDVPPVVEAAGVCALRRHGIGQGMVEQEEGPFVPNEPMAGLARVPPSPNHLAVVVDHARRGSAGTRNI